MRAVPIDAGPGVLRSALARLIVAYQRHISPRKGYGCAYRVGRGRCSCSEHGRRALGRVGVWQFWLLMRRRFRRCAAVARELRDAQVRRRMASAPLAHEAGVVLATSGDSGGFGGAGPAPAGAGSGSGSGGGGGAGKPGAKGSRRGTTAANACALASCSASDCQAIGAVAEMAGGVCEMFGACA